MSDHTRAQLQEKIQHDTRNFLWQQSLLFFGLMILVGVVASLIFNLLAGLVSVVLFSILCGSAYRQAFREVADIKQKLRY